MDSCGLYVHVPFCETKCGYCDFYSVAVKDRDTGPLVHGLLKELGLRTADSPYRIRTLFVGGGTPTILPPADLHTLFSTLGGIARRHAVEEWTVEANPATLDEAKLEILTAAGVDRISMGAQSWHARELEALERLHSPDDIAPSVRLARRSGIRRINLDLIFGIAGQTLATWRESLQRTIDLDVDHIACYGLTYEPGTRLTAQLQAGRITPCDEDLEGELYLAAIDLLADAGYEQYEISNFARPGQRCEHNLIYWRNEPYIGVGPSAAGCVGGERYKNVADLAAYVARMERDGRAVESRERVTGSVLAGETLMMQLRLNDGVDVTRFRANTGVDPFTEFPCLLTDYAERGLLDVSPTRLALTRPGRLLADTIIAEFFAALRDPSESRLDTVSLPVLSGDHL